MTNRKSHMGFRIDTKIDDLGRPWTAVRSNSLGISRDFACLGGNNSWTTHSICVKLLHIHDKLTQCCRAFTLALARLSCCILKNAEHVRTCTLDTTQSSDVCAHWTRLYSLIKHAKGPNRNLPRRCERTKSQPIFTLGGIPPPAVRNPRSDWSVVGVSSAFVGCYLYIGSNVKRAYLHKYNQEVNVPVGLLRSLTLTYVHVHWTTPALKD